MTHRSIHKQSGITVLGFLLLAVVFGVVGLAVMKIVPLYLEQMKIRTVLKDVQTELASGDNSALGIRNSLDARFYVDYLELPADEIEVKREGDGFLIHITRAKSSKFFGNLDFVLDIDEQVEITR